MADYDDRPSSPQNDSGGQQPLAPLPKPFEDQPKQVGGRAGCGKVSLIGCGVLLLLFGIAAVIFVLKANDMLVWVLSKLETQIESGLPEDLSPAERERFDRAFADLYSAIESGEMDPFAVQDLQRKLLEVSEDVETGLSHEQTMELIEAVELAAGTAPEEDADGGAMEAPPDEDGGAVEEGPPVEEGAEEAAPEDGGGDVDGEAEDVEQTPVAA